MEKLVDRARAAMNLILVLSLVLGWVSVQPPKDALLLAQDIIDAVPKEIRENYLSTLQYSKYAEPEELPNMLVLDFLTFWESDEIVEIASETKELKRLHFEASLRSEENVTFEQLNTLLAYKIKVPFLEQEVRAERALLLISAGLLGPYLYFLSITWAMRGVSRDNVSEESLSWIFFHPHWLGPIVGTLWLYLSYGFLVGGFFLRIFGQSKPSLLFAIYLFVAYIGVGILITYCLWMALQARRRLIAMDLIQIVKFREEKPS